MRCEGQVGTKIAKGQEKVVQAKFLRSRESGEGGADGTGPQEEGEPGHALCHWPREDLQTSEEFEERE